MDINEQLTELLVARLPSLIAEFRHNMEAIGMLWEQPTGDNKHE